MRIESPVFRARLNRLQQAFLITPLRRLPGTFARRSIGKEPQVRQVSVRRGRDVVDAAIDATAAKKYAEFRRARSSSFA